MSKPKIALFFGAGAEISYGLPSGGKFALDIFKMDVAEDKAKFKMQRGSINKRSIYATNWLPQDYETKPVSSFGKSQYETLVRSSLENKRNSILNYLNDFDKNSNVINGTLVKKGIDVKKAFTNMIKQPFGTELFSHEVKLNEIFGDNNKIFGSEYFSAFLKILEMPSVEKGFKKQIKKITRSLLELLIGACGEDLVNKLNDGLFDKKPDEIDIFDDLGGIFSLDYKGAGLTGLDFVLNADKMDLIKDSKDEDIIYEFGRIILEEIFAAALDYQSLMDFYWRYLYCPKTDWSRFCRVSIFLNTVRRYIVEIAEQSVPTIMTGDGYYHDVSKLACDFEISSIGTTNYNNFIHAIIAKDILFLNGSVDDYYDPYLNQIINSSIAADYPHFLVPFLFTQSGIKPLTTVKMSKRYVELYENFKSADAICVIGYGFNIDDGHINGMFRELIDVDDKKIKILHYTNDHNFDINPIKDEYQNKLRIETKSNLEIIPVNASRKIYNENKYWYEKILEVY